MMNENELYWAAGFFDGEGTIGYHPGKKAIYMKVVQVANEPLERFQKAVGGGKVYGPYKQGRKETWRPIYMWQCTKLSEVRRISALLIALVCNPKRLQIEIALEEFGSRDSA